MRSRNSAFRGFTLIELLVAIAVIVLLAALLLPGLAKGKDAAKLARCKSNEHQIGVALTLYVDDAKVYPMRAYLNARNQTVSWSQQLSPYLANARWGEGVFKCPSYHWGLNSSSAPSGLNLGPYAYNAYGFGPTSETVLTREGAWGGLGGASSDVAPDNLPVKESMVAVPSEMYAAGDSPVLFEGNFATHLQGGLNIYVPRYMMTNSSFRKEVVIQHKRGYDMLFVDTHVEYILANKLFSTDPALWSRWNRNHWAPGI